MPRCSRNQTKQSAVIATESTARRGAVLPGGEKCPTSYVISTRVSAVRTCSQVPKNWEEANCPPDRRQHSATDAKRGNHLYFLPYSSRRNSLDPAKWSAVLRGRAVWHTTCFPDCPTQGGREHDPMGKRGCISSSGLPAAESPLITRGSAAPANPALVPSGTTAALDGVRGQRTVYFTTLRVRRQRQCVI